jgi:hypothetical protein
MRSETIRQLWETPGDDTALVLADYYEERNRGDVARVLREVHAGAASYRTAATNIRLYAVVAWSSLPSTELISLKLVRAFGRAHMRDWHDMSSSIDREWEAQWNCCYRVHELDDDAAGDHLRSLIRALNLPFGHAYDLYEKLAELAGNDQPARGRLVTVETTEHGHRWRAA